LWDWLTVQSRRSNPEVEHMLNVSLIEQFQMIYREQRGGAVEITLGERKVRFGFEQGELILLDVGEEKELAMARKLLDYHKIGPEIHRHAVAMARATGGSIVETLRRQQLISESEVDQVAQAMIEDLFSLVFGIGSVQMTYRAQEELDTFDTDKRAVRLKIDVPSLLESVQARVADEEAVIAELGGWNSSVALDEGGDSDKIDDFERHILTQVDGKKSVEQIAIAFRDSNYNIGKMLVGLMQKGFVKKGGVSNIRPAATTVANLVANPDPNEADAATLGGQQAQQPQSFEVYKPNEPVPSNAGFRFVLGTVLVVLLGIGVFVWLASSSQGAVSDRLERIAQHITQGAWSAARDGIDSAAAETGNDLSVVRKVKELSARLDDALNIEAERIDQLLEKQKFAEAGVKLEQFPIDHPRSHELRQRRVEWMKDFEVRGEAKLRQVLDRLDRRDVVGALALIDKATPAEAEAPLKAIDRWRMTTIEQAKRTSLSLGERQALVNILQNARPTGYQKEQIALLQDELNRGQNRRQEQIRALNKRVDNGAWLEVRTEVEKERLLDQAPGSALLAEVNALMGKVEVVRKDIESIPQQCNDALMVASDPRAVVRARQRLADALTRYPEASNLAELQALDHVLAQLEPVVGRGSTADEATALGGLLTEQSAESPLVRAARARIAALRTAALEAQDAIESARKLGREGQWDDCIAALTSISTRPEWKRTPTGLLVADEIAQAQANKVKLAELSKQFRARLDAGDIAGAYELSRQMGLRYLPLLVESMPPGATVVRDGKDVGKTPLIIEISAGDRLDLQLELRAAGCLPLTLSGANATGGWRLTGALRRKPISNVQLKTTISAAPAGGNGRLWVSGAAGVAAVTPEGTVSVFPYAGSDGMGAPNEPVYAPATVLEDGVYIATRERFALRIAKEKAERVPLAAATDSALVSYRSAVILDRRFLICAGLNGAIAANDPGTVNAGWTSAIGAPFAGPLTLIDDMVFAVRRDGEVLALQVDRGDVKARQSIGESIVAAWPTNNGMAGITATVSWAWNGVEVTKKLLPRNNAVAGAPGLIVTKERQVLVLEGSDWKSAGQIPSDLTTTPILWKGHPVLVSGKTVYVLGSGGFQFDATSTMLAPAVVGDNLALTTSDGDITFFAP